MPKGNTDTLILRLNAILPAGDHVPAEAVAREGTVRVVPHAQCEPFEGEGVSRPTSIVHSPARRKSICRSTYTRFRDELAYFAVW